MDLHFVDEQDDYCPNCGVPVPFARRGRACPHCGRDFADSGPRHMGTIFGYGVLGATWGVLVGLALAMTGAVTGGTGIGVPLTVGGLGTFGLLATTETGKRIEARRGMERRERGVETRTRELAVLESPPYAWANIAEFAATGIAARMTGRERSIPRRPRRYRTRKRPRGKSASLYSEVA